MLVALEPQTNGQRLSVEIGVLDCADHGIAALYNINRLNLRLHALRLNRIGVPSKEVLDDIAAA